MRFPHFQKQFIALQQAPAHGKLVFPVITEVGKGPDKAAADCHTGEKKSGVLVFD